MTTPAADSLPELIVRSAEPPNLEFPFDSLAGSITPNERFFVRNHFPVPQLDRKTWRLRVEGAVDRPFELTFDALAALPRRTVPAVLECAGNGRSLLEEKVRGVQWGLGAVSNAEWTGARLSDVLERAGIRAGAVEVVLEGADRGIPGELPRPAEPISFARSLPLAEARREDVLLAYEMNGASLPPEHGFPVRVLVPGWYGVASVKWLTRLLVTDRPFQGYYQSIDYTVWEEVDGHPVLKPLGAMPLKAQIAHPAAGERLAPGSRCRIHGAAWSGETELAGVDVSVDGGGNWAPARLLGDAQRYAWRFWELDWEVPKSPGSRTLLARARGTDGRTQPAERDLNRNTYMINHVFPVEVEVAE